MLSIAKRGKVAPQTEKPIIPQSEHILIDILNEGMSPKTKTPKPCDDNMVRNARNIIIDEPPGCGKFR